MRENKREWRRKQQYSMKSKWERKTMRGGWRDCKGCGVAFWGERAKRCKLCVEADYRRRKRAEAKQENIKE